MFVATSWFLVAGLIAIVMAPRVEDAHPGLGGWKYVVGVVFAVVLYFAVLLHEASHAVMARRFGFSVHSITLHFLGGATAIEGEAKRPKQEFWIAVVGPLTSLAVGVAAVGLWFVTPEGLLRLTVEGLAGANLLIGVLNLIPGLPLDGGRVLKSAVWRLTGRASTGTVAAGWGGRVTALAVLVWPFAQAAVTGVEPTIIDSLLFVIISAFLWSGATQAILSAKVIDRVTALDARALARRALVVPHDLPLAEAVRRAHDAGAGSLVTASAEGVPVGVVNEAAVRATPSERQPWVAVSTVARSLAPGLRLRWGITGGELLDAIRTTPATEYVLDDESGGVYGVLSTLDVEKAVREAR